VIEALTAEIVACRRCPRLVEWRERVAREKVARFAAETYWGRPVPGFGDPDARVLLVGLAPAAHGGNRTGRIFTGDRSGDFLWQALHATGFANKATARRRDDGLVLTGVYLAAAVRCAPPINRPTPAERDNCLPYLVREIALLRELRVIVPLGAFAWAATIQATGDLGHAIPRPRPRFGHGAEATIGPYFVIGSFHPSQQNTFTGKLTQPMLREILSSARSAALPPRGGATDERAARHAP
jgi:uracil-DNA glycosylase family 4